MAMNFPSSPTVGQTYSVSGGPTYTWDGNVWKVLTPGQQYSPQVFTATAGQTTFTISGGYVIGAIDVFRNGVKLVSGSDYTATDLATVVLVNACSAGDTVEVITLSQILYSAALKNSNNLSDVSNAATALANLGGLPKAGGTMTGVLDLGAIGQVKFPATQNPSSDANTLDDYEEGTWTPNFPTASAATYTRQNGVYTKVGRMVFFQLSIQWSSQTGASNQLGGLPYPSISGAGSAGEAAYAMTVSIYANSGLALPSGTSYLMGYVAPGSTNFWLTGQPGSSSAIVSTGGGNLYLAGYYTTAQ